MASHSGDIAAQDSETLEAQARKTMRQQQHTSNEPHDERLAALAGAAMGDAQATHSSSFATLPL